MIDPLVRLAEDRRLRDAARANFHANLERVSTGLKTRGLGERMSARVLRDIKEFGGKALDIADESKGIIAATGAAIVLWLLRNPLIELVNRHLADDTQERANPVQPSDSEAS